MGPPLTQNERVGTHATTGDSEGYPLHQFFLLVKFALNHTICMVQGAGFEPANH